jgi:putative redox protein
MAVMITGESLAGLTTAIAHDASGVEIRTAAPIDNSGDGSSFSPTDLVAAALASCMVTTMAIVAQRERIPFSGAKFAVEKHMRSDPRRIDRLPVRLLMPPGLGPGDRERLEYAARTCPVMRSLSDDIEKPIEFAYPD